MSSRLSFLQKGYLTLSLSYALYGASRSLSLIAALLIFTICAPLSSLNATPAHEQEATLWDSNDPLPTKANTLRKARAARLRLQKLLAHKARLLQLKEEATRKAETQAHLTAHQLAQLQQRQAALAHAHMRTEQHLTTVTAQLAQLSTGQSLLDKQEQAILRDEGTRLLALHQLNDTPELSLLLAPASTSPTYTFPSLPFSLLALRHTLNQRRLAHLHSQQTTLYEQQGRLQTQSHSIAAQETRLQNRETLAQTRTQEAARESEQAQAAFLRQQTLLTQARQSTQSLTTIIIALAQREAETRRRLRKEKAHFHKLHQKHKEQEVEQTARALNPGTGLTRGKTSPPVQGRIVTHWAQATEAGPATGLTYQTAPLAPVIAPCTGQVLFSGDFRSFGPMVILDCGAKQRLVLAGLGTLRLRTGQPIQRGNRLGEMPSHTPLLFVQLRQGTRLRDPAQFF